MKRVFTIFLTFSLTLLYSQNSIEVTDQTIKIPAFEEKILYFGFAKGDQIVFSFEESRGKALSELEILKYPKSSKFSDFKPVKIDNKTLAVNENSVYAFRFKNLSLGKRVCKIHIKRIPKTSDLESFNTEVYWEIKQDTVWNSYTKDVVVRHDTVYEQKTIKELVKTELKEELILDKSQRVHSSMNENGNKTSLLFSLPQNFTSDYETSNVVSWAYWVGVGNESNNAWKSNVETVGNLAQGAMSTFTSPLGALALGAITDLVIPKTGEDVYYAVTSEQDRNDFMYKYGPYSPYDNGKGVAGYRNFKDNLQGDYYILLKNDNYMHGIDVNVKVVAIVETKIFEDRTVEEQKINPIYEKKIFKEPTINTSKIPVLKN